MLTLPTRVLRSINQLFIVGSIALMFMYFLVFSISLTKIFSPFDNIEESAYTYTTAFNYLKYGPLNSLLLQDESSSPYREDHPYVYNHMPAGPDLVVAAVLRATKHDIEKARLVLGAISLGGLFVYLSSVFLLLERFGSNFAGICLFVVATSAMALLGRVVYALMPFLVFFPLLIYLIYLKRPRPVFFHISLFTIFLSSLYIEYSLLSAVLFSWIMLFLTGLLPLTRKQIVLICSAFALGIVLHLVQNFLFLGPAVAFKELSLTLSNRIRGVPTQAELHSFYESLNVVHHGAHAIAPGALWRVLYENLTIPGSANIEKLIVYLFLWAYCTAWAASNGNVAASLRIAAAEIKVPLYFLLWLVVTICAPIFLFPAFAQEVNLLGSGGNLLFFGIVTALVMGRCLFVVLSELQHGFALGPAIRVADFPGLARTYRYPATWPRLWFTAVRAVLALAIAVTLFQATSPLVGAAVAQIKTAVLQVIAADQLKSLYAIEPFRGGSFMTNINSPTVGFLTQQPGYGVCGPDSVGEKNVLDLAECKISYMRRLEYWKKQRPGYFFYFERPDLFPGFADCMPSGTGGIESGHRGAADCMTVLLDRLQRNYPIILQNDIVRIFDLGGTKALEFTTTYSENVRELAGEDWWYWVRDRIDFAAVDTGDLSRQREVSFDYTLLSNASITVTILGNKGQRVQNQIRSPLSGPQHFDLSLPMTFGPVRTIEVSGEGEPVRLGPKDPRLARFRMGNLKVLLFGSMGSEPASH